MIVFHGWGALVGVVLSGLIGLALIEITGSYAFSCVVMGIALTGWGLFFNVLGGERWRIFWVPVQYWGVLVVIGALLGAGQ